MPRGIAGDLTAQLVIEVNGSYCHFSEELPEKTAVIITMASNSNGDLEDGGTPDTLKPPPRSKSRTKSVDELVAKLEEQNR